MNHSPIPWRVSNGRYIENSEGVGVAICEHSERAEADAECIVDAVNHYGAAISALATQKMMNSAKQFGPYFKKNECHSKVRWNIEVLLGGILGHIAFQIARRLGFDGYFSAEVWIASVIMVALITTPKTPSPEP